MKERLNRFLIIFLLAISFFTCESVGNDISLSIVNPGSRGDQADFSARDQIYEIDSLSFYSSKILSAMKKGDNLLSGSFILPINRLINKYPSTELEKHLAYPLYLLGSYYLTCYESFNALPYYFKALSILEKYPVDSIAGKVNYNLGVCYNNIGDHIKSEYHFLRSFEYVKREKGEASPELATDNLGLSIASIFNRNFENALKYSNMGLEIAAGSDDVPPQILAQLYQTRGNALARMSDYSQAVLSLSRSLRIYDDHNLPKGESYINLLDNLGSASYSLGNTQKALDIFGTAWTSFNKTGSYAAFNLSGDYAAILGQMNRKEEGREVLYKAFMNRVEKVEKGSREYAIALFKYADYIGSFDIDRKYSLKLYGELFDYLRNNPWDKDLRTSVSLGYAVALSKDGKPGTALDSINSLLRREAGITGHGLVRDNPPDSLLNRDSRTLKILLAKFNILTKLNARTGELKYLLESSGVSEIIIKIIEDIRINIGEEQSRLLLGDYYREAYLNSISSFLNLYTITGNPGYLEKAIEFSEKSKAASLLASLREMKAMRYYIPKSMMAEERKIFEEISFYTARLEEENNRENPDPELLNLWEKSLYESVTKRDSLKELFEKNYPDYYDLKYNSMVAGTGEIKKIIGKNNNYLSYIVSDSLLYILVVNRKHMHVEAVRIDSSFNSLVVHFRHLLSEPQRGSDARKGFEQFQNYGYSLYEVLVKPVEKFFISRNIIISPDNILAFFPFETLITGSSIREDIYYSRLDYLMNDYRISYAYSATLLSETEPARPAFRNRTAAFAPVYEKNIFIDSIPINRQVAEGVLSNLKYAKEEALYVSKLTSGVAFTDEKATKSTYIQEAGRYDILHMAMHTVLKAGEQISSGMIFSDAGTSSDRVLRPFEIYSVPLNSRMVVLSSCYTGAGMIYAGEGVLSLARGFIFSGSRSVVMSLWEVDDKAGTEIIKEFYHQLKSGKRKSDALRSARLKYLKNADMLRSHPYFWSTIIVYGDNSPLYISHLTRVLLLVIFILLAVYIGSYLMKR